MSATKVKILIRSRRLAINNIELFLSSHSKFQIKRYNLKTYTKQAYLLLLYCCFCEHSSYIFLKNSNLIKRAYIAQQISKENFKCRKKEINYTTHAKHTR